MINDVRETKYTDDVYYFPALYQGKAIFKDWSVDWNYLITIGVQHKEIYQAYAISNLGT
jgi:hypothetical protein